MPHDPTLADMAAHALAAERTEQRHDNRTSAADAERYAHSHASNVLGADPAALLSWEHTFTDPGELYAARAPLHGTPGWYLRWATDEEGDTITFDLHRPCAEGGHHDPIRSLAELGEFLEQLNNR